MSAFQSSHLRAAQQLSWFILFMVGVALIVILYFVKTGAQSARKDVRLLQADIQSQVTAIQVLKAEHAFLSRPQRLKELSEARLSLEPISPEQTMAADDLIEAIPLRKVQP